MRSIFVGKAILALCTSAIVVQSVGAQSVPAKSRDIIGVSVNSRRSTPQQIAYREQVHTILLHGEAALKAKNFVIAENDFREILSDEGGYAYFGLAQALTGEGKPLDALQAYWQLFHPDAHNSWGGSYFKQAHLEYALLLNQTGHWDEAISSYEAALPDLPSGDIPKVDVEFDPETPQPRELEAAIHVALGLVNNWGGEEDSNRLAMQEYQKALQLEPNWPIANYYYGFGWQQISPAERTKFGIAQQAKAALTKAVKLSKGPLKKAAQKAL